MTTVVVSMTATGNFRRNRLSRAQRHNSVLHRVFSGQMECKRRLSISIVEILVLVCFRFAACSESVAVRNETL